MTSKAYDAIKFTALVILPGLGALYFGVAQVWGLPYAEQVVGTITLLDTFVGLVVKRASTIHQQENDLAPVIATMKAYTDFDGVPTGRFSIPSDAFDGAMLQDQKLISLRVQREIEQR